MKRNLNMASLAAIAGILDMTTALPRIRYFSRVELESEALKSANAKINAVRQERRAWLLKEREVRSLNCRERRELERNIYAEY